MGEGNKIEIHTGSASGTLAGTCELAKTANNKTFVDNDCEMKGLTGVIDQVFFVFKNNGKDSTMGVLEWEFQGTKREPEPQSAFGGTAWAIPGKIEMEDFDEPGYGAGNDSYADNDSDDHGAESNGGKSYREGTGVDIYKKATGYVVGYNQSGEWLEYTVEVAEAGDYTMYAAVASANATSSFKLSIDGDDITEEISVPQATAGEDNYDEYNKVSANVTLPAGSHILRFTVTGDWMDIDYINFVKGKNAEDDCPIGGCTTAMGGVKFQNKVSSSYRVFDLKGSVLGTVDLTRVSNASAALKTAGFGKGVYMLKQVQGSKTFMVNTAK